MEIKDKLYPHPVLWSTNPNNDDYKTSTFECKINQTIELNGYKFDINFELKNKNIKNLIAEGFAEFVLHIESPLSSYREIVSGQKEKMSKFIFDNALLGEVSLCPFIIVSKRIKSFTNDDLNDDYRGEFFDLDKGTIIAIGDRVTFDAGNDIGNLGKVNSIFKVCKIENQDQLMRLDYENDKITIYLNIQDYENYHIFGRDNYKTMIGCLLLPALMFAIERLKCDFEGCSDYRWVKAIEAICKKYNKNIASELTNKTSLELAQELLRDPISEVLSNYKTAELNIGGLE